MSIAARNFAVVDSLPGSPPFARAFHSEDDQALSRQFLDDGYVVVPVEDTSAFDQFRREVAASAAAWLKEPAPAEAGRFLDQVHTRTDVTGINEMRMAVINDLNRQEWMQSAYFSLARQAIQTIVGNELAMQRRINLSIQMPGDQTSVMLTHADVWDGNSPYEVVMWVPLVDCTGSKSMFLLPRHANAAHLKSFRKFAGKSVEDLFHNIEPDLVRPEVRYGEVMIFPFRTCTETA